MNHPPSDLATLELPDEATLDAQHRRNARHRALLVALPAVGVAALAVRALGDGGLGVVGVVVVLGACVAGVVTARTARTTRARHSAVAAARPGADVVEVWGAAGLRDVLVDLGVPPTGVHPSQGTALTLVVLPTGVELWVGGRQPVVLWSAPWGALAVVAEAAGSVAADGPRPAAVLVTGTGHGVVLLLARRATGALLTASVARTRQVVARLEAVRTAPAGR